MSAPWWFDAPSVMTFYGVFHTLFDRWLWKWSVLRKLGLVQVPNLNGQWTFQIASNYNGTELDASVRVNQTWRSIQLALDTPRSRSTSLVATLLTADPNEFVLNYEYLNTPKQGAVDSMHIHRGSAELRFPRAALIDVGSGEYYSGRDRANQGQLTATRQ